MNLIESKGLVERDIPKEMPRESLWRGRVVAVLKMAGVGVLIGLVATALLASTLGVSVLALPIIASLMICSSTSVGALVGRIIHEVKENDQSRMDKSSLSGSVRKLPLIIQGSGAQTVSLGIESLSSKESGIGEDAQSVTDTPAITEGSSAQTVSSGIEPNSRGETGINEGVQSATDFTSNTHNYPGVKVTVDAENLREVPPPSDPDSVGTGNYKKLPIKVVASPEQKASRRQSEMRWIVSSLQALDRRLNPKIEEVRALRRLGLFEHYMAADFMSLPPKPKNEEEKKEFLEFFELAFETFKASLNRRALDHFSRYDKQEQHAWFLNFLDLNRHRTLQEKLLIHCIHHASEDHEMVLSLQTNGNKEQGLQLLKQEMVYLFNTHLAQGDSSKWVFYHLPNEFYEQLLKHPKLLYRQDKAFWWGDEAPREALVSAVETSS